MANKAAENKTNKYEKIYIGKGTQVEGMDIIRVSVDLEAAMQFVHNYKGKDYLTFEVAKMQNPDNYGKTHTAYISEKVKEDETEK